PAPPPPSATRAAAGPPLSSRAPARGEETTPQTCRACPTTPPCCPSYGRRTSRRGFRSYHEHLHCSRNRSGRRPEPPHPALPSKHCASSKIPPILVNKIGTTSSFHKNSATSGIS